MTYLHERIQPAPPPPSVAVGDEAAAPTGLLDFARLVARRWIIIATAVVLGVLGYKPREFASQMNLNLNNGWAIVRTFVDMVMREDDGKYVLVKDPNKPTIRLYQVPADTFEEDEDAGHEMGIDEQDE